MAGEIQLNSTTMATESSGSITAELDTIRPNTTNGSLTLQGDSSNSGVTGLTIDSSGNTSLGGVLKLKSSGNTVTASNGTSAVLSESSSVVTLNNVQFGDDITNNNFAYYTMSGQTSSFGTGVAVFSAYTAVLEDTNFYTSSFGSNILNIIFQKAGYYKISNSFYILGTSAVPSYQYQNIISGTATRYGLSPADTSGATPTNIIRFDSGLNQYAAAAHHNLELSFLVQATANQTIAFYVLFPHTISSGTLKYGSNLELIKVK